MSQTTNSETTLAPIVSTETELQTESQTINRVFGDSNSANAPVAHAPSLKPTPSIHNPLSHRKSRLGRALLRLHATTVFNEEPINADSSWPTTSVTTIASGIEAETLTVSATPPSIEGANEKPATDGGRERRAFPRRDSGCVVSVCRTQNNEPVGPQELDLRLNAGLLKGPLVDLSMNGVAFVHAERLVDGEFIYLRLTNRRIEKQTDASASVLKAVADEEGGWKAICRLEHNLPLEDVHEFTRHLGAAQWV